MLITAAIVFILDLTFETLNKHGVDKIKEAITTIDNTTSEDANTTTENNTTSEENTSNETSVNSNNTENVIENIAQ